MCYIVIKGKQLGKKIGFPTLNLEPAKLQSDCAYGVYFCYVIFQNSSKKHSGILHYGPRKTLHEENISLEVHLFDFNQDVYGEKLTLKIGEKIRGIRKFENLEELKLQIREDVERAKKLA